MASGQHGSVRQSTWWPRRSIASLVAVLLAAFGLLTLTAPGAQALGTGTACVFIQPQGAKWAVGNWSGNFGHIGWGYQVAGSTTWVFGSTENPNGIPQINAPGFNGAWKVSGTWNDMINAFNLQSHYPSRSVNPASLSDHPSAPYTRYKCEAVNNTNVTNANNAAAGNLVAGYTLGTNDCLDAVIRVLQGYNAQSLPSRYPFFPTPNTWFDALNPSTWILTGNLGETWINLNSSMYLDLSGPGTANGTPIHQWSYNGGDNQWWFRSNAIYGNVFTRYGSNKCMGVGGGSQAAGAPVVEWDCNGHPDQQWIYIATGGYADGYPLYHIINLNSGQCLGVQGGSTALGSQVVQWPCNGHPDQDWF